MNCEVSSIFRFSSTTVSSSDFEAKKRWIENTDNMFTDKQIKLQDEYNIIDEFDSHHNYLQSMFNYVIEEENFMNFNLLCYI